MKKIFYLIIIIIFSSGFSLKAETVYDLLVSGDREKAIDVLRYQSEKENNLDAKYVLGILYTDASSINLCQIDDFCLTQSLSNYKKAKQIYLDLYTNHNDPRAAYALAEYYDDHWYFSSNYKKAFKHYLFAAENGVPEAQFNVANMYEFGDGIKKDLVQSVRWYLQCNYTSLCGAGYEGIDDLISQLSEEEFKYAQSLVNNNLQELDIRITIARQIVVN
ncbi:sel1 repeat family protein [Pelagibacteraceae bacterium]|nr:sel1 repeat family protein [Pelagibacteraceae bacterium]